ncbi:MAG: Ig-like domain-containing protein, partial [Thermoanaerobaculia bacterium]
TPLVPPPIRVAGARQDLHLDPAAHKISLLFSRPVTIAPGGDLLAKFAGSVRLDRDGIVFEAPRPIFAAAMQDDGRVVNLSFDHALSTNASYTIAVEPLIDPLTGTEARFETAVVPKIDNDRPAGILYGKFLTGDSKPIAGGEIKLYSGHHVGCASERAGPGEAGVACNPYREVGQYSRTREDGSFLFESIVRDPDADRELTGSYRAVGVTPDGRATLVDGAVRLPGRVHVLNLQLLGRGAAEGTVRYDDGTKAIGVRIYVGSTMFNIGRETTTDTAGAFRVDDLPVGPLTFSAADAAGNVAWASGEIATPGQVAVRDLLIYRKPFPGTGTIFGTVRRSDTLEPVFGARVGVFTQGFGFGEAMTDSTGRFEFRKVPAGFVTVLAAEWSVSRESAASDFDLRPDETKEVGLTLAVVPPSTALVALVGDVVRENALDPAIQEPVPDAVVKLGSLTATADAAGHFRLEGLPVLLSGKGYTVKAWDPATRRIGEMALPTLSETAANYVKVLIGANSYGSGTIRVRVIDAQGLPVVGMRVIEPGYPPSRIPEVGGGLYEWKDAPVGAAREIYAVNAPAKYGDQYAHGTIGLRFPGQAATLVLRLPGQGTVRARLRGDLDLIGPVTLTYPAWDELEQGLSAKLRDGSTGENGVAGWATFAAVPAVTAYRLESAHPTYGYVTKSGALAYDGDLAEHTLQLNKLASIRGVVYAIDGLTPIPSAEVRLEDGRADAGVVYTQPDGSFAFHDVPAGVAFSVTAAVTQEGIYRTGIATGRTPSAGGPAQDVAVILRRRGSVEGRVVHAAYKTFDPENPANNVPDDTPNDLSDNAPVPLARFWLRELEFPSRAFGSDSQPLTADIGGRFALSNVFVGSLRARAWDGGNQELRGDWTGTLTYEGETLTGPIAWIAIGAGGAGTVQATVADPNQQYAPIANAEVQLFRAGTLFDATSTDGAGLARFEQVPVGTYSIGAYSKSLGKSGGSGPLVVELDRQVDLRVLLEFVGKVDGRLSDPESNPPDAGLPGAPVLLRGTNYTTQASTDGAGLFFFEGVREGRFELTAKATESNRRAAATGVLTPENRHPFVSLELERTFPLHVAVMLPDDRGADSGRIAGTFEVDVQQRNGEYHRTLQGNQLVFSGLFVNASWVVKLREVGGAGRTLSASGKHPAGSVSDPLKIVYPAFGDLEVVVTQAGGLASGARVGINGGGATATLYTDASGKVFTHGLPLGVPLSVQAKSLDERFSGSAMARVERQSVAAHVTIDLGDFATITGLVEAEGGGPSAGTRVLVTFTGQTLEVLTNGDGRYTFNGIPTSPSGTVATLNYVGADGTTAGGSQSVSLTNADAGKSRTLATIRLDATPPQLLEVLPVDGAASVSPDSFVRLVFSEPVHPGLITDANLQLLAADGLGQLSCSFEAVAGPNGTFNVTMRPPAPPAGQRFPLKSNTLYRIVVVDRIADLSGHRLPASRGLTFTTADYAEPRVVKVVPAVTMPVPQQVTFAFHFNEPIDPQPWQTGGSAQLHFYKLSAQGPGGQILSEKTGNAYVDPSTGLVLFFAPTQPIEAESFYRITIAGVRDLQGNPLGEQTFHFVSFDNTAPYVRIVSPVPEGTPLVAGVEYLLTPDLRNGTADGPPASDVASVDYSRVDGAAETFLIRAASAPFAYRFVAPDAPPEGAALTLRARAVDKSGNASQPATMSWTVKPNAAPASVAVTLTPASAYPSNPVSAKVTFADEGTIASVQLKVRASRTDGSEHTDSKSTQVNRANVSAAWPAASFDFVLPGNLESRISATFTATVTDVRGLAGSATAELPLLVDAGAPVIHTVKPDPETLLRLNETYQVEAVVSDVETGVAEVAFRIEEKTYNVTSSVAGPLAGTRKFVSPAITVPAKNIDTRIAITVTAKDHAGNAATRAVEVIYVGVNDPAVPRAAWLCPIDRSAIPAGQSGLALPLRIMASDDVAITSVKFRVDGVTEPVTAQRVGTTDEYEATLSLNTPAAGTSFGVTAIVSDADAAHTVELPLILEVVAVDRVIDAPEAIDADNAAQYQNRSFAVRGAGKLVTNVPVTFTNLIVLDGARVEALPTSTTTVRRVDVTVAERLYVDCASFIDMTARGYLGGWQENPGGSGTRNEDARGRTVGNSPAGGANATSGSHAGLGGSETTNETYGSITTPADPGSGGGGAASC